MKKTIFTFGLISGAISSLMMLATVPFQHQVGFDHGLIIGYTSIVLSFLLVFFGIRSYRDNVGHGEITFAKGVGVGLAITVISCLCYVLTWEILYYNFLPDFWDKYGAYLAQKARNAGASAAAVQAQLQQAEHYRQMYRNPLINGAMTFIEPFPVGLVITLISAAVLRKRRSAKPAESVASA